MFKAFRDGPRREPATTTRARKYGMANQMAYEASEKRQRENTKNFLAQAHALRRQSAGRSAATTKSKKSSTGMNSGTYGGARAAFFGR